jgi:hypothetical protein
MTDLIQYKRYITLDELSSIVTKENVNVPNLLGNTILHDICEQENVKIETIQMLLQKGADPNIINNKQQTPFYLLCANELVDYNMMELMFKYKANPNINNCMYTYMNNSPMYENMKDNILQLMICNGADLNYQMHNRAYSTFYNVCRYTRSFKTIRLSLQYNADLNIKVGRDAMWYGTFINRNFNRYMVLLMLFHNVSIHDIHYREELRFVANSKYIQKRNRRCLLILQLLRYTICGPIILSEIMENHFMMYVDIRDRLKQYDYYNIMPI